VSEGSQQQVVRVETNRSCPLRCQHCPCDAREDPQVVRAAPRAIARAREGGFRRLIFSGGEPLLRKDLERLVAFARSPSPIQAPGWGPNEAQILELETSAIGLDPARAAALRAAGLDLVRVPLPGWGPSYEQVTRVPGSFASVAAGLRAAAAAELDVELDLPILRANVDELASLPIRVVEQLGVVPSQVQLHLPRHDPDPVDLRIAVAAIEAVDRAVNTLPNHPDARPTRTRLLVERVPPPCMFTHPGRTGYLFGLSRGGRERPGYRQPPGCETCTVADRCPGFPIADLERDPSLQPAPIADARTRRRLTVLRGVDEQIARELVSRELGRDVDGNAWPVHTIRVQFLCNQACEFCFVSTHLPNPSSRAIREAVDQAAAERAAVALSGGEPTLNPELVEHVRYAKRAGIRSIELQTNAIRLADPALCQALADAGVDTVFVSLHGSRAEIGDAITSAPGTWAKSVAGLDQLARIGLPTRVNFVMCRDNADDFPATVELVAARWPDFPLTFSFVAPSTDLVPRTAALIPRYTDVFEPLLAGLERARALGLNVTGFESMCSIPLCLKPDGLGEYLQLPAIEGDAGAEFEKPEVCDGCSQRSRCWGVRRGYVSLYGSGELRAL
jgi:MoaA/NifB/PqqE/SkfB family radical SAM enzyme